MSAHVVRAIIISLGVIAALGIAAYQDPVVQQWVDEQRRKLAVLLRNIGDELDPQSRREAEAYAFGSTQNVPPTAASTGVASEANTTVRRVPVQGTVPEEDREVRQRLGREYLARRNQQMLEMQERRRASRSTSFDSLVDDNGRLKHEDKQAESSSSANPFGDHNEIDRHQTPRPAVPPKIKLEEVDPIPVAESVAEESHMPVESVHESERSYTMPGSMPELTSELTFEEQLTIALQESENERLARSTAFEDDTQHAIRLSLEDHSPTEALPAYSVADSEDLYNVTPNLTRATLATLNQQHPSLLPIQPELPAAQTPTEASSYVFDDDRSETLDHISEVEVTDAASDLISQDGIVTPDSWSEIGSHDGDVEADHMA